MHWNRRDVFKLITGAAAFATTTKPFEAYAAPETAAHPNPSTFASGDLIWSALPDAYIPYDKSLAPDGVAEEARWIKERDEFLRLTPPPADTAGKMERDHLQQMSYSEFLSLYLQDTESGGQEKGLLDLKVPRLSVGHVGIVEVDGKGKIWVVEATPTGSQRYKIAFERFANGVERTAYSDWISQHEKYNVWHGRVKTKMGGERIVNAAKSFLGRDYWIWSLNFDDETAFYCSKLVWVSVFKALGIPLDGDTNKARQLWLSPKRLMKLDTISMLFSPAPYGE